MDSIAHSNINVRASITVTGLNVVPVVSEHNYHKEASSRDAASDSPVMS